MISALGSVRAQGLESLVSPGELSRAHREIAGLSNCSKCHNPGEGASERLCLDCHDEIASRIESRTGFHRGKAKDCQGCHAEHRGVSANLIPWIPTLADHRETGYPLEGLHGLVRECEACHSPERSFKRRFGRSFLLPDRRCAACHEDAHRGQLGSDCARCHSVGTRFKETTFDHNTTSFSLAGAHRQVACSSCHKDGVWTGIRHEACADCHTDPHRSTLGQDCTKCHSNESWKLESASLRFDHGQTRFPLIGAHSRIECRSCHAGGRVFNKMPFEECRDCHTFDPHFGQFQVDCSACHTEKVFEETIFKHEVSRFPLAGRHSSVECTKCHAAEQGEGPQGLVSFRRFKPVGTECAACHKDIHLGQLEVNCAVCHSLDGFGKEQLNFAHDRNTEFKLVGKHNSLKCLECHKSETADFPAGRGTAIRFNPISRECVSCHGDQHARQLGDACQNCHGNDAFKPAVGFRHERARFQLQGKHTHVSCAKCHLPRQVTVEDTPKDVVGYRPLDRDCRSCHSDPHHSPDQLDCAQCHSTSDFVRTSFNHFQTAFPLAGRHKQISCARCHTPKPWQGGKEILTFGGSGQKCTDCHVSPHRDRYTACQRCHGFQDWRINDW